MNRITIYIIAIVAVAVVGLGTTQNANANANKKYAAIVVDANNGKVLHSENALARRYPASLTKMMTLYLIFEDIQSGKITKKSKFKVSNKAARRPPSKLGLKRGQTITVNDAILALVTKSANDVATAVAENLDGTQKKFVSRMNTKAKQLGMNKTIFKNASGLTAKGQITTATDMAKLGIALKQHFPQHYHYFNTRTFKYGKNKMKNSNKLLGNVRGVDGIKTGFTNASGFNLVTSVDHNNKRLVAVVMGGKTGKSRDQHMKQIVKEFLPFATNKKAQLYAKLPKNVAKPAKISRASTVTKLPKDPMKRHKKDHIGKIIQFSDESDSIAAKIKNAHAASIGTSETGKTISQAIKLAWSARENVISQGLKITQEEIQKYKNKNKQKENTNKQKIKNKKTRTQWQIQISATKSKEQAEKLMIQAKEKIKNILTNVTAITKPATLRNGQKIFQARFIGFKSKKSAQNACKKLIQKRFECVLLKA